MNKFNNKFSQIEETISSVLRIGVYVCGLIITAGWVLGLCYGKFYAWSELQSGFESLRLEPPLNSLLQGLLQFDPNTLMNLGLMALIGLPMIRVGATIWLFVRLKDYLFTLLATWVLIVLVFSYWYKAF